MELMNCMIVLFLIFVETPYCFSWWSQHFTFPRIMHEGSLFSTSSPTLVIHCLFIIFIFCVFSFFLSFFFYGHTCSIWKFLGQGLNGSCSCQPTPQQQQRGIPATSVTYTTAHSDNGSLTHCERPGIEPTFSWIIVRFVTAKPRWELMLSL